MHSEEDPEENANLPSHQRSFWPNLYMAQKWKEINRTRSPIHECLDTCSNLHLSSCGSLCILQCPAPDLNHIRKGHRKVCNRSITFIQKNITEHWESLSAGAAPMAIGLWPWRKQAE